MYPAPPREYSHTTVSVALNRVVPCLGASEPHLSDIRLCFPFCRLLAFPCFSAVSTLVQRALGHSFELFYGVALIFFPQLIYPGTSLFPWLDPFALFVTLSYFWVLKTPVLDPHPPVGRTGEQDTPAAPCRLLCPGITLTLPSLGR